jgi:hypothetical protein
LQSFQQQRSFNNRAKRKAVKFITSLGKPINIQQDRASALKYRSDILGGSQGQKRLRLKGPEENNEGIEKIVKDKNIGHF